MSCTLKVNKQDETSSQASLKKIFRIYLISPWTKPKVNKDVYIGTPIIYYLL